MNDENKSSHILNLILLTTSFDLHFYPPSDRNVLQKVSPKETKKKCCHSKKKEMC